MPSKKTKQKMMKRRIAMVARICACISFLILTIIGVSSLVRAMSLEAIANENGIPSSWKAASLGNPENITVPITYWDQRQDDCSDENRQFEWSQCQIYTTGALQGVVKPYLGTDGLPIPAYTSSADAWNANHDVFTMNVTGHEPVLSTDNFYRWFHETALSKKFTRQITFTRKGNNTYTYGSKGVFPLDDVSFSNADAATKTGHNFHFTSHLRIPMKLSLDGKEVFSFLGDDDVWVYLNGQLVLDIGGLHQAVSGKFTINQDGTISTYVDSVAQPQNRSQMSKPSTTDINNYQWRNSYLNQVHNGVSAPSVSKTITTNLKSGDVVNLDFFYAERSTSESNTEITIADMNWPISADSDIQGEVVGLIEGTENQLVRFDTSITNRDPENSLHLERLAAYVKDIATEDTAEGFIPLSSSTLYYTGTPDDPESWQPVDISAPSSSTSGFNLSTPLVLEPSGENGDTLYFRYFAETAGSAGNLTSTISYYTTLNSVAGVTYDYDTVSYEKPVEPEQPIEPTEPTDPSEPTAPVEPENPNPAEPDEPIAPIDPEPAEPETPASPEVPISPVLPVLPSLPSSDIIAGELIYLAPLGEIAYVPNTGIISDAFAAIFDVDFAEMILSQGFVMLVLLAFAGSFATWFSLRKYMNMDFSTRAVSKKQHPKMPGNKVVRAKVTARGAHASRKTKK